MQPPATDPWLQQRRLVPTGRRSALYKRPASRLHDPFARPAPLPSRFRLLTFNIQSGIRTQRYREFVTRGWRQVLHDEGRLPNLDRIGDLLQDYHVVALQEVDAGSLRSGFTNQVAWLARRSGQSFWYAQRNRRLGRLAQHGNGLLATTAPLELVDHPLPTTLVPGRGAIVARFAAEDGPPLTVICLHLSLGARSRARQLEFVAAEVRASERAVVVGDLNCSAQTLLSGTALAALPLTPACSAPTWPSWRPRRHLDHVLVTPGVRVLAAEPLECAYSDHLPLSVELALEGHGAADDAVYARTTGEGGGSPWSN